LFVLVLSGALDDEDDDEEEDEEESSRLDKNSTVVATELPTPTSRPNEHHRIRRHSSRLLRFADRSWGECLLNRSSPR
jgi:hypothetical protein